MIIICKLRIMFWLIDFKFIDWSNDWFVTFDAHFTDAIDDKELITHNSVSYKINNILFILFIYLLIYDIYIHVYIYTGKKIK